MYAGSMPDAYILRTEIKLSGIKSFVNTEIGWFFKNRNCDLMIFRRREVVYWTQSGSRRSFSTLPGDRPLSSLAAAIATLVKSERSQQLEIHLDSMKAC